MAPRRLTAATLAGLLLTAAHVLPWPASGRADGQAAPPAVTALVDEGRTTTTSYPGHEGHQYYERTGTLDTGRVRYGVKYCSCYDPSHGDQAAPLEGYIGMPEPAACNWYHSGFLRLVLNGQDIGTTRLADMYAGESGERGSVSMVWKTPQGVVRARFLALPDDPRLFCELALDPTVEVTSLQVALNCYPSFFTAAYHRDGWRRVTTALREGEQGSTLEVKPAEEWWLAYTDDVFDPAKSEEAAGGCAVLFDPEQVEAASVSIGSYGVGTSLAVRPSVRAIRFAFWDFSKQPNAEAARSLRETAAGTLKALRDLDFTPLSVTAFDLPARSAAVAAELKKVTDPADFPARFEALYQKLEPLLAEARKARAAGGAIPVETEKAVAEQMRAYNDLEWELRFHVLLND